MKIYISADIEGVNGIAHWDEATRWKDDYPSFRKQMMNELRAACIGVNTKDVSEIWIKDAHGVGRNLTYEDLPTNTRIIRAFSGHPFCMMQELDKSFDAVMMIGYHSRAGSKDNPLSHTLSTDLSFIKINGQLASEFTINSYTASYIGVPVIFLSGDAGICKYVKDINSNIETVSTNQGIGNSVISKHPEVIETCIKEGVINALEKDISKCNILLPAYFQVELGFLLHTKAYRASFYPGMNVLENGNLSFETDDYFEVLRMLSFIV